MADKSAVEAANPEAARDEALHVYFGASHAPSDTPGNRRIFEAGFDHAWALLSQILSSPPVEPANRPETGGSAPSRMRQMAKWKQDSELLEALQTRRWDVRFSSHLEVAPGEAGPGVQIFANGEQPPDERVIGVDRAEDLRGALWQALVADGTLFAGSASPELPK